MNTQSNALPESFESQRIAPATTSATRPFYWSVRRELWENRSIYIAPLAVAAVALFGYLIATMGYAMSTANLAQRRRILESPYGLATSLIMAAAFLVSIFYSLEALHGERRDHSILFWKSLPVSDLTTILSKASIPLVVLPLLSFVIVVATVVIMLLLRDIVLLGSGVPIATPGTPMLLQMGLMLLYHLITVHVLWYAPFYGWLLLVSAWARRAAFLWAFLPPVAIGGIEKIAFHTTYFFDMLRYRFAGGGPEVGGSDNFLDPMTHFTPGRFLASPGLWIGLLITAAFIAAAVRLRRQQGPI
jgi:ABC-2 type transport system permease protein